MANSKFVFKLPITREEFKRFLSLDSIFRRTKQVSIDVFIKNFFPEQSSGPNLDDSSSGEEGPDNSS